MKTEKVEEEPPAVVLFEVLATPDGLQVRGSDHLSTTQRMALCEALRIAGEALHASLYNEFVGDEEDE